MLGVRAWTYKPSLGCDDTQSTHPEAMLHCACMPVFPALMLDKLGSQIVGPLPLQGAITASTYSLSLSLALSLSDWAIGLVIAESFFCFRRSRQTVRELMTLAVHVVRPDLTHTARGRMHRRDAYFCGAHTDMRIHSCEAGCLGREQSVCVLLPLSE